MWGPVLYVALMTMAVVISQIPNLPLAIAAGMIFGPFWGGVYSIMGGVLGASIDFWIGRLLGRKAMQALTGKTLRFCDRCTGSFIGWIIFLTRLLPVFSFDVISYGAGLTNVPFRVFLIATLAGGAPMTFVLTYLGDVIQVDSTITLILTSFVLIGLFLVPWLIRQYNVFGLRDRIIFE